ncbi:MAG: class I SAM-dependent methyltransferase [Candidatus Omnitrophota bacterium]
MKTSSRTRSGEGEALGGIYWDDVAEKAGLLYADNPFFKYKKREILRLVNSWGQGLLDKRILKTDLYEESLGFDDILFDLARNNDNVFGIDISPKIVAMAEKRAKALNIKLRLLEQDVKKIDFQDESFDLIISNSTLDHFPGIRDALSELHRVLKKRGVLILTLHNKSNLILYLLCSIMRGLNRYHNFYVEGSYSLVETERLARGIGFKVLESDTIIHIPPLFPTMINLFYKSNIRIIKYLLNQTVRLFESIGKKKYFINHFTGYLIAIKAVKE